MVRKAAAPVKKAPAKKAAAKRPVGRRLSQEAREAQEAALQWSVDYGAPIMVLDGWDPGTGEWAGESPIGAMLELMAEKGVHLKTAADRFGVEHVGELVAKGLDYKSDEAVSQDRLLIPVDIRVFVDLAMQVRVTEAMVEITPVGTLYESAKENPRDALAYLARRFPARWRDQADMVGEVEVDPRDLAVSQLLEDPNNALVFAQFARKAEALAADLEPDEI